MFSDRRNRVVPEDIEKRHMNARDGVLDRSMHAASADEADKRTKQTSASSKMKQRSTSNEAEIGLK